MVFTKESIKELMNTLSELGIQERDKVILFGGDLYKEIPNYPGYYVSTEGKILGPSGNLIKLEEHYSGYYKVHLRGTKSFVHRLVMTTFMWKEGCEDLVVNHKDLDKKNNHLDNLEWASHMENSRHYQAFSFKEKITEEVKDKIMSLPKGFTREDLNNIFKDI